MNKNFLALALSFAFVSSANAMFPPEPANCPDVGAIKSVGVSNNVVKSNNVWFAGRGNQMYGTADHWTFIIGDIVAMDSSDARSKATVALASLSLQLGPFMGPLNKWVCLYNTMESYPAVAVTSPISGFAMAPHFYR